MVGSPSCIRDCSHSGLHTVHHAPESRRTCWLILFPTPDPSSLSHNWSYQNEAPLHFLDQLVAPLHSCFICLSECSPSKDLVGNMLNTEPFASRFKGNPAMIKAPIPQKPRIFLSCVIYIWWCAFSVWNARNSVWVNLL